MIEHDKFATKEELFTFLRENKKTILQTKKAEQKNADSVSFFVPVYNEKGDIVKAEGGELLKKDSIRAKIVINTTNLLDSHMDVHMKGIWKKTVKENPNVLHLQEHDMKFASIISDDAKPSVKTMKWSELGLPFDGETEALIFDSEIKADRNPFMFEQYAKGYVKQHSVGMRYVNYYLCMNSDSKWDVEEKANWDKYIGEVANAKQAEDYGYFFAVTEAKMIEGSAVVKGSNFATPTLSVKEENNEEPLKNTLNENKNAAVDIDTVRTALKEVITKNI